MSNLMLAAGGLAAYLLLKPKAPQAAPTQAAPAPASPPATQSIASNDTFADILAGFTALANGVVKIVDSATNNQQSK